MACRICLLGCVSESNICDKCYDNFKKYHKYYVLVNIFYMCFNCEKYLEQPNETDFIAKTRVMCNKICAIRSDGVAHNCMDPFFEECNLPLCAQCILNYGTIKLECYPICKNVARMLEQYDIQQKRRFLLTNVCRDLMYIIINLTDHNSPSEKMDLIVWIARYAFDEEGIAWLRENTTEHEVSDAISGLYPKLFYELYADVAQLK